MALHEVIELLANSIMVRYEVVQTVLNITPIFVETMADNLPKCEVMASGDEEGVPDNAAMCPRSQRPTHSLSQPCLADVARQLLRGPWHDPRPSRPGYPQMRRWTHTSLWQAAKVLLPRGVPGTGLIRL